MKKFDERLINLIKKVGVKKGDVILVHLDIYKSISLKKGIRKDLEYHYFSLKKAVGNNGTIVVPAFFYEYARNNQVFDLNNTPPSRVLGFFPLFMMKKKNKYRSVNPISSLIAIGKYARFIGNSSGSAFGYDSSFYRLNKLNAKMLFIGIDCHATTFVHFPEYVAGVPHMYNKYFNTSVVKNGKKLNLQISGQVRYLNRSIEYNSDEHTKKFEKAGLVKKAKLRNSYFIRCLKCDEVFKFLLKKLKVNFSYLLKKKPKFKKGQLPWK